MKILWEQEGELQHKTICGGKSQQTRIKPGILVCGGLVGQPRQKVKVLVVESAPGEWRE